MQIRDRIKEFRRVRAGDLRPHPRNWRTHPQAQQDAMRGMLAEIGYADALLARELSDGSLQLVDGHLRAESTPDAVVPVLILDVSEEESLKLLATLDPLCAMAGADAAILTQLVADVEIDSQAVRSMLDELVAQTSAGEDPSPRIDDAMLPATFQVVIDCGDESQHTQLYERLSAEGLHCRVLCL